MLIIVDPQIDFITGSLPVPGAVEAMDKLADYVRNHGDIYSCIVVTCDRHKMRHSSFKDFGGTWPSHCVESSVGAAVWPDLMNAFPNFSLIIHFLYKGESLDSDEYSILQTSGGREFIFDKIREHHINEIDICGLAGDVCVATTIEDAMTLYPDTLLQVIPDFIASLDGGDRINNLSETLALRNVALASE